MVILVTLLHYNTAMHIHEAHGIYRRLYYFPIIIAAFRGGRRAGVLTAACVCVLYAPHALGWIGFDPAPMLEKSLEMVLYLAIGLVCGVLVDRQRAARAGLRRTAEDLERALRERDAIQHDLVRSERLAAVGQLSAGLAHEIRNPLASIKGSADLLADDFPAAHPKGRFVRILQEESARLNDVLTRFLAFARPTDHGRGRVDLAGEIASVAELLRTRRGAPRVLVETPPGDWFVDGDPVQIRQLLLNVGLNAADAASADGIVSMDVWREGAFIAVAITDDGPGFDDDALANFGTPFFSTRPGGTGLGLATSVRIAQDHGGSLAVDEAHTPGARVVLRLPAAKAVT